MGDPTLPLAALQARFRQLHLRAAAIDDNVEMNAYRYANGVYEPAMPPVPAEWPRTGQNTNTEFLHVLEHTWDETHARLNFLARYRDDGVRKLDWFSREDLLSCEHGTSALRRYWQARPELFHYYEYVDAAQDLDASAIEARVHAARYPSPDSDVLPALVPTGDPAGDRLRLPAYVFGHRTSTWTHRNMYYVKWCNEPWTECSWEDENVTHWSDGEPMPCLVEYFRRLRENDWVY
jgi:hypothetical protein